MRNPREIRALTGLRGVAAVFVAAYHFGPHITNKHFHWALHKGYLSVDLFFVLSGLVMAMTYQHWFLQGANPRVFARYMWLRIARIWPLYLTAVLAALAMQVFRGHDLSDFTPSLLPNLLMIQSWGLAPSINPPLWSVSTEFVAYLLFPGLLMLVARGRTAALSLTILGCLLLIVGIFAMLYVRERRLWIWLARRPGSEGTEATMALSVNRKTIDTNREFEHLKHMLLGIKKDIAP